MWGAFSDGMTGLSFTIGAGPRQRSHSRVRVQRGLLPYFTVSDSRLRQPGVPGPFLSPPTTRRVTVDVFELIAKRSQADQSVSRSVGRSVKLLLVCAS
jgi:hypothetical protein